MTVAVIIATGWTRGGPEPGPAAALGCADDPEAPTQLARLQGRLGRLNVPDRYVVARPEQAPLLRKDGHDVVECADPAADLREIARLARRHGGPLLLLPGDVAIGDEQLVRLLRDVRAPAAALTVAPPPAPDGGLAPVRTRAGLIDSAGSPYHRVTAPDAAFPGVLRVDSTGIGDLAGVAEKLALLLEVPGAFPEPHGGQEAEAAGLLLVGLVRSGVPVTAVRDDRLPCLRAASGPAAHAAHAAVDAVDEDRIRLADAVKSDDGFFATYAVSSYSPYLVRLAAWRGLTPNAVTCVSLAVALLAAVWFAAGTRAGMVAGAVLFYLSFVLDCVDGQLARYTRQFSALGAWLDAVGDRAKEYAVFAGLAVGSSVAVAGSGVDGGNVWPLAVAALALQTVRHMIDFCYAARPGQDGAEPPAVVPLSAAGDDAPAERPPAPEPAGRAARLSAATSRVRALHWAKKIVVLPIGERFALISLTAAFGDARLTFTALLAWGTVAAAYTLAGRVLRARAR
ncbi:CDP-alcohol phosphatidyltransferase family protein [Actinomadura macrotermitis]|uniref:CDP-alcohol phosphatidyltransferase n=1 Tax=Actinomadura macrotermitis TaxID=2585200 RepID=A0A7K0C274_9ACTN|nr:CDP-alcohol phosphatidyltransferase family protein [Actinomadura macrotermitis]MQY07212.1 hypothetical protein [Actinomadura macrotermitis]